jgi:hypothetical protein
MKIHRWKDVAERKLGKEKYEAIKARVAREVLVMTSKKKAEIMFALCAVMAICNAAAAITVPVAADLFGLAAGCWASGAVAYYFLDFNGRVRK